MIEGVIKSTAFFFLKRLVKRVYAKLLERTLGPASKIRLSIARGLDRLWFGMRKVICDPKCWEITEVEICERVSKEATRAKLRYLKR